jgi:hypothetical protein
MVCFAGSFQVRCQSAVVREDTPYLSKSLAGVVTDENDAAIAGATVTRMSTGWKTVIQEITTNEFGKFTFQIHDPGLYYLRISGRGFQTHEVKVRVSRRRSKLPRFKLQVAT